MIAARVVCCLGPFLESFRIGLQRSKHIGHVLRVLLLVYLLQLIFTSPVGVCVGQAARLEH